ncbi:MAG TPA: bifunctional pyr operon transcriptional regulator/uracil phosphoribosyltransferase PyrR [Bacteroidetes bacterium]|nr:bifunctional pyr operon transcriptional regulator/uracil phosphoribosyltransferase PyrR [Bacteroidota bacterium]
MKPEKIILEHKKFRFVLERISRQLIENHGDFSNTCLIGIQDRGGFFADRLYDILKREIPDLKLEYGKLDITFYRDDFRRKEKPLAASKTEMDFLIENKNVIIVDDVLYTGRTIQAALSAMQHYGRPASVELAVMVDRRFNRELPIQADYIGTDVDTIAKAYVDVKWEKQDGVDEVVLHQG